MNAKWKFEPKRRSQKSRDPMQASFFTNASIDDDNHALVREAIQNSLDAKQDLDSKDPVRIRFSLGKHPPESGVMKCYISDDAWKHFSAKDNGLKEPPSEQSECHYLVYEDFNTRGLAGDETASEAQDDNSFYYFMRAEGQSGKQQGDRGRHGIGKYVFPYTSAIRTFIAVTVRADQPRCLVAGQSVLKLHHVDGACYTPDGWWGEFEEDGPNDFFQLPVSSGVLFSQLKQDFGLDRKKDQNGLSIIIPYIREGVTREEIAKHVAREFFWPILRGELVVEVSDAESFTEISSRSLYEDFESIVSTEAAKELAPYVTLAYKAHQPEGISGVELICPSRPCMPKWDDCYLTKEIAKQIREKMDVQGAFLRIRCPLYVMENTKESAPEISEFDLYLFRDGSDKKRKPLFIREGIVIPEDHVPAVQGYTSVVVISSGPLATLLGDSENPAHTEWEKNAPKFKNKYRWGAKTIDFVRLSVKYLFQLISQGDEEEDTAILSDIFYLDLPENEDEVPESRKRKTKRKRGKLHPPRPDVPPKKPRTYRLSRSSNGFKLSGPLDPFVGRRRYRISVAFDFVGASKAKALKNWNCKDFDIGEAFGVSYPLAVNTQNLIVDGNTITFEAEKNDFWLSVSGFDGRRDIIVDVVSEAVNDEEV